MKKTWLLFVLIGAIGMDSCGPNKEEVEGEGVVSRGSTLCECINMTKKEQTPECEAVEKEWEVKYEDASEEGKSLMQAEFEACKSASEADAADH